MKKCGIDSDRLYEFFEKYITKKYKNKLIFLDNASSHSNEKLKLKKYSSANIFNLLLTNSC
jgi:hypothetical protein